MIDYVVEEGEMGIRDERPWNEKVRERERGELAIRIAVGKRETYRLCLMRVGNLPIALNRFPLTLPLFPVKRATDSALRWLC